MGCSDGWDSIRPNSYTGSATRPVVTAHAPTDPLVAEYTWEISRVRRVTAATPEDALKKALTTPVAESDEEWRVRVVKR